MDDQGGGLAAPSSGCSTLVLPQGPRHGWGWAPQLSCASGSLLGTASLYLVRQAAFVYAVPQKVSLLSPRWKCDCRVMEQGVETGLSELSGCGMSRQQQEPRFPAAAHELEGARTWSAEALVLAVPGSDTVNPWASVNLEGGTVCKKPGLHFLVLELYHEQLLFPLSAHGSLRPVDCFTLYKM